MATPTLSLKNLWPWLSQISETVERIEKKLQNLTAPTTPPVVPSAPIKLKIGMNMPGYENDDGGQPYGYRYILPYHDDIKALVSFGIKEFRLPVGWGHFQTKQGGDLVEAEVNRLVEFLHIAKANGASIQPEFHNYAWTPFAGNLDQAPSGSLADAWRRLVTRLDGVVSGIGLMNEPANCSRETWKREAQLALNEVQKLNPTLPVYVCGAGWSGPDGWTWTTPLENDNQVIYEAHGYPDPDNSGTFKDTVSIVSMADRFKSFHDWLVKYSRRGSIGEYGTLEDDNHVAALGTGLAALKTSMPKIESFYYWCGNGWGDLRMSAYLNGTIKPQLGPLLAASA